MATHIQTVLTAPVEGRDAEFNRWYDAIHMPEVLRVPGFVAGQRYAPAGTSEAGQIRYLALYEIETDDLAATLGALAAASAGMTLSDALDMSATVAQVYEVLGDRQTTETSAVTAATAAREA